uniref:Uncharacterized protein n=1 Tax=Timema cristinae TaxID=61476 RepID=A0A7R9CC45_TIMCR|nr:unnamed protein product [Timema cristinae]
MSLDLGDFGQENVQQTYEQGIMSFLTVNQNHIAGNRTWDRQDRSQYTTWPDADLVSLCAPPPYIGDVVQDISYSLVDVRHVKNTSDFLKGSWTRRPHHCRRLCTGRSHRTFAAETPPTVRVASTSTSDSATVENDENPVHSRLTTSLAMLAIHSGLTTSLAVLAIHSGLTTSLAVLAVHSRLTTSLAVLAVHSRLTTSLAMPAVHSGLTTSLAMLAVHSGLTTSLAVPAIHSGLTTSLAMPAVYRGLTTSLAVPAIHSGLTTSLAMPAIHSGLTTSLAVPAIHSGLTTSLAVPAIHKWSPGSNRELNPAPIGQHTGALTTIPPGLVGSMTVNDSPQNIFPFLDGLVCCLILIVACSATGIQEVEVCSAACLAPMQPGVHACLHSFALPVL